MYRLSKILELIYWISIIIVGISALSGNNQLFSYESYLYVIVINLMFLLAQRDSRLRENPLFIYFQIHILLFYISRLVVLSFFPFLINYQSYLSISNQDIVMGLRHLTIGNVFIILGFKALSTSWRIRPVGRQDIVRFFEKLGPFALLLTSFILIIMGLVLRYSYGYYILQEITYPKWLLRFTGGELIPFTLILVYLYSNKIMRRFAINLAFFYVIFCVYMGTRAPLFNLVLSYIFLKSIEKGDFFVSKKTIGSFLVLFALAIVVFFTATAFRLIKGYDIVFSPIQYLLSYQNPLMGVMSMISERFADFEALVVAISDKGRYTDEFYSFGNVIKSSINALVPGDVFPNYFMIHRYYKFVFIGYTLDFSISKHMTMPLTPWGEYYLYFGYIGCYLSLFISSVIFSMFYNLISSKSNHYKVALLFIILYVYRLFFVGFGLDFVFKTVIGCFSVMITYVAVGKVIGLVKLITLRSVRV